MSDYKNLPIENFLQSEFIALFKVFKGGMTEEKELVLDSKDKEKAKKEAVILEITHNTSKFTDNLLNNLDLERLEELATKHKLDNDEFYSYDFRGIATRSYLIVCKKCQALFKQTTEKCPNCKDSLVKLIEDSRCETINFPNLISGKDLFKTTDSKLKRVI